MEIKANHNTLACNTQVSNLLLEKISCETLKIALKMAPHVIAHTLFIFFNDVVK